MVVAEKAVKEDRSGYLGGDEPDDECLPTEEDSKVYQVLKKDREALDAEGVGLDGHPFETPEIRIHIDTEVGVAAKKEARVPEHLMRVAGILTSILKDLTARGIADGWDNHLGGPAQRFIDVEGGEFKRIANRLHITSVEKCAVYHIIKKEMFARNEKEQVIRDVLLQYAFPHCS